MPCHVTNVQRLGEHKDFVQDAADRGPHRYLDRESAAAGGMKRIVLRSGPDIEEVLAYWNYTPLRAATDAICGWVNWSAVLRTGATCLDGVVIARLPTQAGAMTWI